MSIVKVSEKKINSTVSIGDKTAVIENIRYPYFEEESQEDKGLCGKMNSFYTKIAEKYSSYARLGLVKKIRRNMKNCRLPMCLGMKFAVSECGGNIISVVLDLSFSEGRSIRMRRFSQMWHREKKDMITVNSIVNLNLKNKKRLVEILMSQADEKFKESTKDYFSDYLARMKKYFCFGNCFASPSGLVFFFDAGVLREEKYGATCFVVPYENITDMLDKRFLKENIDKQNDL